MYRKLSLRLLGLTLLLTLLLLTGLTTQAAPVSTDWWVTNGYVYATALSADGSTLYIGGDFTYVGPPTGSFVALDVNGAPDSGFPPVRGDVYVIESDGAGGWYIGGRFTHVGGHPRNNLAHILPDKTLNFDWDPDANDRVHALVVSGNTVYVGGFFTSIGGETRNRIAALNSTTGNVTTWNPDASAYVSALAVSGSIVYAGGGFTSIGGEARNRIAALNVTTGAATSWDPDANSWVADLVVSGSTVYVGGNFTSIGGQPRNYIAALDTVTGNATAWDPNADSRVSALVVGDDTVYAGGVFNSIGGETRNGVAALDTVTGAATAWNPNITGEGVIALAVSNDTVYIGGGFISVGGEARNNLAALDVATGNPTVWNPSAGDIVWDLAVSDDTVYAGGEFTSIGGETRNRIAALDTATGAATAWNPDVSGGVIVAVYALSASDHTIYAGGRFTGIGGEARNNIAAIDTTTGEATAWNPNANLNVSALAVSGSTVYAGGGFTNIGGEARSHIAAIDTTTGEATSWNPNASDRVSALVVSGSTVYAGGGFTSIGGEARNYIAALDAVTGNATAWNPDANNSVSALVVSDDTVYAGGGFTSIGGEARNYIAALDSVTSDATIWNPNANNWVYALGISSNAVYAGGGFTSIGGEARNYIAALDTATDAATAWNPNPHSHADNWVRTLAVRGDMVYAGGRFTSVGGLLETNLAALRDRAETCAVAASGGSWRVDNWANCGGSIPIAGDSVVIGVGHHIVQYASVALDNLTVAGGLTIPPNVTFSVEVVLTNTGTLTHTQAAPGSVTTRFGHMQNAVGNAGKYYGVDLTPAGDMGYTTVAIRGHQDCPAIPGIPSVQRCYNITPGSTQNATIRFYYTYTELNGQTWNALRVWQWDDGWTQVGDNYQYSDDCIAGQQDCWVQAENINNYAPFVLAATSVTVNGPSEGIVDTSYTFTATVNPTATLPITYTWATASESLPPRTGGLTDTAVFSWTLAGTHTVTVTATGESETVTDTHAIVISALPTYTLTLLHTNDVHARVDEFRSNGTRCTEDHAEDGLCIGGVARLATVVNEIRADKENVLLLDAGDQFQGTLFFTLFGADVLTDTMTALDYDAMAIGNHEFDSGPAELARFIDSVDFLVLGSNIEVAEGCVLEGKILPTAIITRSGEPIGLIGLVTPATENISSPGPNVSFTAPITAAQAAVNTLTAQGVNKIIALTHIGYGYDLELAEAVEGIDVIIGGHSHTFLYTPDDEPVNFISPTLTLNPVGPYPTVVESPAEEPVLVVQAYQWGIMLGELDVTFDADGILTAWEGNPIYIDATVEKDAAMEALLDKYRPAVADLITAPVGEIGVDLLINVDGQQICRLGECLMGNLVADAMLWMANEIAPEGNYQIAFQNGGGLRAALNAGEVTMGDVMEVLPFGNVISLFQLKGEYVIAALENGMSRYPDANGGFAQVSGLRYQFDASKPAGSRIVSAEAWNGMAYEPLDLDAIYNVVTNDFMGRGGDNYWMFRDHAIEIYNTSLGLDAALAEYIQAHSPVTPTIEGRILGGFSLTVSITPEEAGIVTKNPDELYYQAGVTVTLTPNPAPGWSFSHWSGDFTGAINPITLTMDADKVITAIFERSAYTSDAIVVLREPSPANAIARLESGELDVFAFQVGDPVLAQQIADSPALESHASYGSYNELTINPSGPIFTGTGKLNPFAVPRVREALNWLIDREYITQDIMGGLGVPRWHTLNTFSRDYAELADVARPLERKYAYNVQLADETISQEMLALGATRVGGQWYYADEPVEIIFLIRTEDERRAIGDYVADQLEAIGFTVTRNYKPAAEASPIWLTGDPADGLFHIYTGSWITTVVPRNLADNFAFFYTDMGLSFPLWQAYENTPEFYELADRLDRSDFADFEERRAMMAQALEWALEDSHRVWLFDRASITPRRAEVNYASDLYGGMASSWLWPHTLTRAGEFTTPLTIGVPSLLTSPWNPLDGSNWIYDALVYRATGELGALPNPYTGLHLPQRITHAEVVAEEGTPIFKTHDWVTLEFVDSIEVPDDAWAAWDATEQRFLTAAEVYTETETVVRKSVVYYEADLFQNTKWHDGSNFSVGDVVMAMIMSFDRAQEDSPYYDAGTLVAFNSFMSAFRGVRIVSENPLIIETYSNSFQPDAENTVTTWWPYYPRGQGAWHNLALGLLAEAAGTGAFSQAKADTFQIAQLDYIAQYGVALLEEQLQVAQDTNFIPYAPMLGQYITPVQATTRWNNLQNWHADRGHFWIGTGPLYLEHVFPELGELSLRPHTAYPDAPDRWASFSAAPIAEVVISGPVTLSKGVAVTFDVDVTFQGAAYASNDLEMVRYLLINAQGETVLSGMATPVADGLWRIEITSAMSQQIPAESYTLEVIVNSKLVAIPSFATHTLTVAYIDTTPPESNATSPAYASTVPIVVSWTANDDYSGVAATTLWAKVGNDGGWASTDLTQTGDSGSFDYTPTGGDGTYYFATVTTDHAGNVEATPTGDGDTSTIYDTVAPSSSATSPDYANAVIAVSWTASDATSGVAATTLWAKFGSDGVWASTGLSQTGDSGTFDYTPTSGDGAYYFATVATDNAGNTEAAPTGEGDTRTLYDTVAPSSSATSPEYAHAAIAVSWTASDATSGVAATTLWAKFGSDGVWASTGLTQTGDSGTFDYTPTNAEGAYYFATVATDNAGNIEAAPTGDGDTSTLYDVTAPTSQVVVPEFERTTTVNLPWTASDNLSGVSNTVLWVKFSAQGVWTTTNLSQSGTEGAFVYTFTQGAGDYYFATVATDRAGNAEPTPSGAGDGVCAHQISPALYHIYLPLSLRDYVQYFEGPWEVEPNNTWRQANGPLISGRDYYGYPNDARDYFSIYTRQAGAITVNLTGHTGTDVQLLLWYGPPQADGSNRVAYAATEPYQLTLPNGPAGWYYVDIHHTVGGYNSHTPYTLRVTYTP